MKRSSGTPSNRLELNSSSRIMILILMCLLLFAFAVSSIGQAAASETVDDCFGGVFDDDPIHCKILQSAHNDGVISVEAIFAAGTVLQVFISQDATALDDIHKDLFARVHALDQSYWERIERGEPVPKGELPCLYLDELACEPGTLKNSKGYTLLPRLSEFEDITLRPGGTNTLRKLIGWSAYRQLYPVFSENLPDQTAGIQRREFRYLGHRFGQFPRSRLP